MRLSICSRVTGNSSITSSMLIPASRFSKRTFAGVRVPRSTHAPLTLPGTLSTAGHCDQSSIVIFCTPSIADTLLYSRCEAYPFKHTPPDSTFQRDKAASLAGQWLRTFDMAEKPPHLVIASGLQPATASCLALV